MNVYFCAGVIALLIVIAVAMYRAAVNAPMDTDLWENGTDDDWWPV